MTMHLGLEMVQVLLGNRARLVRQAHLAQTTAQARHAFNRLDQRYRCIDRKWPMRLSANALRILGLAHQWK